MTNEKKDCERVALKTKMREPIVHELTREDDRAEEGIFYGGPLGLENRNINKHARNRAEQLVKETLRVLMQGCCLVSLDEDCLRLRAELAIRHIADVLGDLSEAYQLDAGLRAALWAVADGIEPTLPEWLRQEFLMSDSM